MCDRPDEQIDALVKFLETEFDRADAAVKPDPGRVTARRLNRTEYTNTIRDLLAIEFRADKNFPTDDSGDGFDNIGDVLTVSPVLMEKYLSAANRIASRALAAEPLPKPIEVEYSLRFKNLRRLDPSNVEATHRFDFDADYKLRLGLPGQRAAGCQAGHARAVGRRQAGSRRCRSRPSRPASSTSIRTPKRRCASRCPEGDHTLRLGFIDDPFVKTLAKEDVYKDKVNKWIGSMTVVGPFAVGRRQAEPREDPGLRSEDGPALRQQDSVDAGAPRVSPAGDAARRWRRWRSSSHWRKADGQSVEQGIALAIQAMLVSPNFLFHIERDHEPDRSDRGASHLGRRAGVAAELLPVELDAGRRAAVARRAASAERAACARRAGHAHARRSEGVRAGGEFRRPVAGDRATSTASSRIRRSFRRGGPSCATR